MGKVVNYIAKTSITRNRDCDTCSACCTWMGVEAIHKWTGQVCRHLDGRDPTRRCSIYAKRPLACMTYQCLWRSGFFEDELRPDKSGLIVSPYEGYFSIHVFDKTKSGDFD